MKAIIKKFKAEAIEQIYLILTRACNLRCEMCIRRHPTLKGTTITIKTHDALRIIDEIYESFPNASLCLSGGEPFLIKDLPDIAQYARNKFNSVSIVTNGTVCRSLKQFPDKFLGVNFQISLDGSREYHDKIRGLGSFRAALNSVGWLIENGFSCTVSTTVSLDNAVSLGALFYDLKHLSKLKWRVSPEIAGGGACSRVSHHISAQSWIPIADNLKKIVMSSGWEGNLQIRKPYSFIGHNIPIGKIPKACMSLLECRAGTRQLYVYPDLRVYGCPTLIEMPIIDLNIGSFSDIENSGALNKLLSLHFHENTPCHECQYLLLCKGGCLGGAYQSCGELSAGDPACPKVLEHQKTIV